MKKVIFLFISVFLAGVISSVLVGNQIVAQVWKNHESVLFNNVAIHTIQSRHQVQLALAYKDAFETQNQGRLYEITCMLLKSNIDHLEIEKYKELSNRISEFNKTKKEATEAYEYLSANGYCN